MDRLEILLKTFSEIQEKIEDKEILSFCDSIFLPMIRDEMKIVKIEKRNLEKFYSKKSEEAWL